MLLSWTITVDCKPQPGWINTGHEVLLQLLERAETVSQETGLVVEVIDVIDVMLVLMKRQ